MFAIALVAEVIVSIGVPIDQNDTAAKIASELSDHQDRLVAVACLSALYAVGFVIYLAGLYNLLWAAGPPVLGVLVLLGGTILVTLHAVSDVGIIGLLGSKLGGPLGPSDDPSVAHTLYLMTFAVDSLGTFSAVSSPLPQACSSSAAAYCRAGSVGHRSSRAPSSSCRASPWAG